MLKIADKLLIKAIFGLNPRNEPQFLNRGVHYSSSRAERGFISTLGLLCDLELTQISVLLLTFLVILVHHLILILALNVQINQGSIWTVWQFQCVRCRMENSENLAQMLLILYIVIQPQINYDVLLLANKKLTSHYL